MDPVPVQAAENGNRPEDASQNSAGLKSNEIVQDQIEKPARITDEEVKQAIQQSPEVEIKEDSIEGEEGQAEFSTENFKVELRNLPKYYGYSELKKLLNGKLQLNARKIKLMPNGCEYTFVNFKTEEERQNAFVKLNGYEWKKNRLEVLLAKPAKDPLLRKRKAETEAGVSKGEPGVKKQASTELAKKDSLPKDITGDVKNAVLPWWNISYEEQIVKKKEEVNQVVRLVTKEICKVNKAFIPLRTATNKFICDPDELIKSPVISEYRNKCEFTIGDHPETKEPTVGFRLSSYRGGSVYVGPVDGLTHLPKLMVKAALTFQDYIRQSKYQTFDPVTHNGTWKQLTVRTTLDDQLLMIVYVNNKLTEKEQTELKADLITYFKSLTELKITSFYFKEQEKTGSKVKNVPELLFGETGITESILGLKFRISPEAFFQINTKAAEVLYAKIQQLAQIDENTTVLDVCCGTGTIGLSMASNCGQVLGVETVAEAIHDAKHNAVTNNLSEKCEFYTAKAEDILDILIGKVKCDKVVAIVDPPRSGVNIKVIQTLRKCSKLTTIVFAFCDAKAAVKNFIDLARPSSNSYKGSPFIPKAIIPVDMFPSTPHYELLVLFQREV